VTLPNSACRARQMIYLRPGLYYISPQSGYVALPAGIRPSADVLDSGQRPGVRHVRGIVSVPRFAAFARNFE
jgi:hypothetical protein